MKKQFLLLCVSIFFISTVKSQTNPAITAWLQNTTVTGSHYVSGNSTPITDSDLAQVQSVYYTTNYSFVSTEGIPAYVTGPFLDGNPFITLAQGDIFKIPLNPVQETGTLTATTLGNVGVFIDGTSLFDYQDGVSYSSSAGADAGGPVGGNPDGVWNRDAVPAEMDGFDCAKGHPAMGNYHHHQNPSAFDLDLIELSDICDLYPADGLYVLDPSSHSPLIGFAYDGFPIYGAYGYANADGTGGITRMKSSYSLRNITVRTHYADGTDVIDGPNINSSYPLGHYREDYEYIFNSGEDYLDEHNGRFAVTPEYPSGTYAYYTTVDGNMNSTYPYAIGPYFYGVYNVNSVNSIPSIATLYDSSLPIELISFQATLNDDYVDLEWITASEVNNDFFTIERSSNGIVFNKLARIDGAGSTTNTNTYSYKDFEYLDNVTYYRIKQTDFDGTFEYGKVVSVNATEDFSGKLTIFPNPTSDFIAVQVKGLVRNVVEVFLFDIKGNLMQTKHINPGTTITYFDTQTLYRGQYIIKINDGVNESSYKVIISD